MAKVTNGKSTGNSLLSAVDWILQADRFLPPEEASDLKRKIGVSIREQATRARREADRLERELKELGDSIDIIAPDATSETPTTEPTVKLDPFYDFATLSADKLALHYVTANPGADAAAIIKFVAEHRGDEYAKNVHGALYKLSKNGKLSKAGEKPYTKYYPAA